MSIFILAFVIACIQILVFGILGHIKAVQKEKWDQTVGELRVLRKDARTKFISYLLLMLSCPLMIPIHGAVIGSDLPIVTLVVIFLEVCFSLSTFSQGHRLILISTVIRCRNAEL